MSHPLCYTRRMKNMKNKMKTYRDMMKLKKMTETDKEFGILLLIMAGQK